MIRQRDELYAEQVLDRAFQADGRRWNTASDGARRSKTSCDSTASSRERGS